MVTQRKPRKKVERQYLTAVTIVGGIITLIDYYGNLKYYRQRGIQKLTDTQRNKLIHLGLLQKNWEMFQELPSYISISYEDPKIMGRARASYPNPIEILSAFEITRGSKVKK